jgi:hypothetical protein
MLANYCCSRIAVLVGVLYASVAFAQDPQFFKVDLKTDIAAKPDAVWKAITNLGRWDLFFGAIVKTDVSSAKDRTLHLKDGGYIREHIIETKQVRDFSQGRGDNTSTMRYVIPDTSLPFQGYYSEMEVKPIRNGAVLHWTCTAYAHGATPEDARKGVEGFYKGCFAGLKTLLENSTPAVPRPAPQELSVP